MSEKDETQLATTHYLFSLEEIKALKRLLAYHYISYEDIKAIKVVRRIMEVEE